MAPTPEAIRVFLERGRACDHCARELDIYEAIIREDATLDLRWSVLCDTCEVERARDQG